MDETIIRSEEKVYCWDRPKMGAFVYSATLGRLVLTDQRLLFLSKKGKPGGKGQVAKVGMLGPLALIPGRTDQLGEEALENAGSFAVPLGRILRCETIKKALVVHLATDDGTEQPSTFAKKGAGAAKMPDDEGWLSAVEAVRRTSAG